VWPATTAAAVSQAQIGTWQWLQWLWVRPTPLRRVTNAAVAGVRDSGVTPLLTVQLAVVSELAATAAAAAAAVEGSVCQL
jgi:hypothetical protein